MPEGKNPLCSYRDHPLESHKMYAIFLAKTFREIFTRDPVGIDTMKNLAVSKGGDDPYHERYVDALQKVIYISLHKQQL